MLLDFTICNWMSFRDETRFSMEGTNYRRYRDRIPRLNKFRRSVLPVSTIFGGNASGKSNFVNALQFARDLVVYDTNPDELIKVSPFLLDGNSLDTTFEFVILIDENIYEYSYSVNEERVTEEKLVFVNSKRRSVLFHRKRNKNEIEIDESLDGKNKEDGNFLRKIGRGTRPNQLFLANSMQYEKAFRPVYDWFLKTLVVITPKTSFRRFDKFFDSYHPYTALLDETVPNLDFGISMIRGIDIGFDQIELPDSKRTRLIKNLKEDGFVTFRHGGNLYLVRNENGKKIAQNLVTIHSNSEGEEVEFEFRQESEGTKRVVDLLPAFYQLVSRNKVLVVDELDRSVHPILIQRIIESYLEQCNPESRSQLIFTTHNAELMDKDIFRPDEIWVTDKKIDGATILHSLCEYSDSKSDNDFRRSYLEGRFGGTPQIQNGGLFDFLTNNSIEVKGKSRD